MPCSLVYLDECMHADLARRLRLRGFNVETAYEHHMAGATDADQLAYATRHRAIIVTHDSRHFRALHLRLRPHCGHAVPPEGGLTGK